jgi:hypothetical protein
MTIKAREELKATIETTLAPVCTHVVATVRSTGQVHIFVETNTLSLADAAFSVLGHDNMIWAESSWADDNKTAILWSTGRTYQINL